MARSLTTSVAAGVVGGAIGSWTMNLFQGWWSRAIAGNHSESAGGDHDARGWQERSEDENANELLAQRIAARVINRPLTRSELAIAAPAVHYGFGAAMGGIYGALAARVDPRAPVTGAAYGASVWITADEVAVPALRLSRPDAEYPLEVHVQALAAHIVYGVTMELAYLGIRGLLGYRATSWSR